MNADSIADSTNGPSVDPDASGSASQPRAAAGIAKSLLVGLILAVVLAWTLLSFGLSLPFMLGLFFFLLFGLIIGAAMFRCGAASRPIPRAKVIVATSVVALTCWSVAIVKEGLDFPEDFVDRVYKSNKMYKAPGAYQKTRADLYDYIEGYLQEHYPPGGVVGYLQLAATGRPVVVDLPGQPRPVKIDPAAGAWVWWTRVIFALVFAFAAIYSQTAGLTEREKKRKDCQPPNDPASLPPATPR